MNKCKFVIEKSVLPTVPREIQIFKTGKPSVELQLSQLRELGVTFGFKSGLKGSIDHKEVSAVREGKRFLEFYKESGAVWYGDMENLWQEKPPDVRAPFKENNKIAVERKLKTKSEEFLRNNKLLPPEAYFVGIETAEVADETKEPRVTEVQTNYGFKLGDIPVVGPGAKITVNFGNNENIIGLFKAWRKIDEKQKLPSVDPEEALEKLKNSKLFADLEENCEVSIEKFFLAYYALPVIEPQNFLFPVYVIKGQVTTPNFKHKFTRYIPAVSLDNMKKAELLVETDAFPDPDLL